MSDTPNILSEEININFKSVSDIQRKLGLNYFNACAIQNALTSAHYEDMSGYQWHDAEKEKPKAFEDVLLMGPDNDVMVGWFDDKDGLFSAYNDAPNMGPADVKLWATLYIPPLKAKEEKKQ